MYGSTARNLRTAERFLLAPPLSAKFAGTDVAICDISEKGARFRHTGRIRTGEKAALTLELDGRLTPVNLEAIVVWTHPESAADGAFVSGARTYASPELITGLLSDLRSSHRSNRIEELRSTDRFFVNPPLEGLFGGRDALIEDLSARGARLDLAEEMPVGTSGTLLFRLPGMSMEVQVTGTVVWSAMKSIKVATARYRAGIVIGEKPEMLRLSVGQLCEMNRAALDTTSLRLKLKIMRARARQLAPSYRAIESSGIPAEQYLLVQGVREELRLNPEEAFHWYRRARITIADPQIRAVAPLIASHPDALAVWEYLDRSVDPSIVGRAFELPPT